MSGKMYHSQAVEHFLQEEFEKVHVDGSMVSLEDHELLGRITRVHINKSPLFKEDVQKIEECLGKEYQSMKRFSDEIMITFVHIFKLKEEKE